ncbi:hypothetical protein [Clostridium sp. Marseille-Q7071]
MIPEIADKPKRGYESVTYTWECPLIMLENKFSFLKGCNGIYIFQDEDNKNIFYGLLQSSQSDYRQRIKFSKAELEKFELELISNSQVNALEVFSGLMYIPDKGRK